MDWKRYVLSAALGIAGFAFAWSVWHLHVDHQNLHALFNLVSRQQQQQRPPAKTVPSEPKPQEKKP